MNRIIEEAIKVTNNAKLIAADRFVEMENGMGRPLTNEEVSRALNCTNCGEPNGNCDCIDWD